MLKRLEPRLGQVRRGMLSVVVEGGGPTDEELRAALAAAGITITSWGIVAKRQRGELSRTVKCELKWQGRPDESVVPAVMEQLVELAGVKDLRWQA